MQTKSQTNASKIAAIYLIISFQWTFYRYKRMCCALIHKIEIYCTYTDWGCFIRIEYKINYTQAQMDEFKIHYNLIPWYYSFQCLSDKCQSYFCNGWCRQTTFRWSLPIFICKIKRKEENKKYKIVQARWF